MGDGAVSNMERVSALRLGLICANMKNTQVLFIPLCWIFFTKRGPNAYFNAYKTVLMFGYNQTFMESCSLKLTHESHPPAFNLSSKLLTIPC